MAEEQAEPLLAREGSDDAMRQAVSECKLQDKCFLSEGAHAQPEAYTKVQRKLVVACALCFVFMLVEVAGGYLARSVAIMSDAAHMLSDVSAFLVSIFATWAATQPSTWHYSFGYHRAEILGALVSVLTIWAVTGALVFEAVQRTINPVPVDGKLMFIVSVAGVVFNILIALTLGVHAHLGHSHGPEGCSGHSHGHDGGGHSHDDHGNHDHDHSSHSGHGSKQQGDGSKCSGHSHNGHSHHNGSSQHGSCSSGADATKKGGCSSGHGHSHSHGHGHGHKHTKKQQQQQQQQPSPGGARECVVIDVPAAAAPAVVVAAAAAATGSAGGAAAAAGCGQAGHTRTCRCTIARTGSREIEVRCELPAPPAGATAAPGNGPRPPSRASTCGGHDHSHGHSHGGHDAASINLRSAVLHVIGDLLQSVGVAIAGALIWYLAEGDPRWYLADPICTFVFSGVVLLTTRSVLRDIVHVLMERTPTHVDVPSVSAVMRDVRGVFDVHDLHIWNISTSTSPVLTAHVHIGPDADATLVLQQLEAYVRRIGIEHSTIQICNPVAAAGGSSGSGGSGGGSSGGGSAAASSSDDDDDEGGGNGGGGGDGGCRGHHH